MSAFTIPLQEIINTASALGEQFEPGDIVSRFVDDYPDLVREHGQALAVKALKQEVKSVIRSMNESDHRGGQLRLEGLDLPMLVSIPAETTSGFVYKAVEFCTFDELERHGKEVLSKNVQAAQAKLDSFASSMEMLRPCMEFTDMSVAEAIEYLSQMNQAA
jgi:hypothetical protein